MNEKKKARRSSILKPPKPRNPLSDIDLNPPMESTFMRQSRRVSFASNNFIKEFKTDPEKNTIWDTTYEEAINKSDPSADCATLENVDNDDFNNTRIEDFDVSMEAMLSNSSEESFMSTNIVLGPPSEEKLCVPSVQINPLRVEPLSTVQMPIDNSVRVPSLPISQTDAANKENNPALLQKLIIQIPQETAENVPSTNFCSTVEQTTGANVHLHQISLQKVQNQTQENMMEMRATRSSTRKTIHFTQPGQTADLDLTVATNNYNKVQKIFKQGSEEAQVDLAGFETEITKSIPRNSKILYNYAKQNMQKREMINFNADSEDANVEVTQAVFTEAMSRHTIHFHNAPDGGDMERTRAACASGQVPAKTSRSSIYFNKNSEDGDMDLTGEIPGEVVNLQKNRQKKCKENEMEMARSYLSEQNVRSRTEAVHFTGASEEVQPYHSIVTRSKGQSNTIHFKQNSQDSDMDFTVQLPPEMEKNTEGQKMASNRRTIHFNAASQNADMEVTQPYSAASTTKSKKLRNTMHFNRSSQDGDMELTEELRPEMVRRVAAQKSSNRGTIHFIAGTHEANMEETQPYSGMQTTENKRQRNTMHFNQNWEDAGMDLTEELAPEMLKRVAAHKSSNRGTIHFNAGTQEANMEVTQPYSGLQSTENKRQRNTMHFNQNSEDAGMDLTEELVPEMLKRVAAQKSSNRGTIHFNAGTQEANMEVTQPYSARQTTESKRQRNTMHFNQNSEDAGMDLTQELAPEMLKRVAVQKSSNRGTIHFNAGTQEANMEVTQPYSGLQTTENMRQRNTMHFNQNSEDAGMDLTEELAPEMLQRAIEHKSTSNRCTIHFNTASQEADMEVTQPYSVVSNAKNKKQRNTMHFNQNSADGNMDLTVQVPLETENKPMEEKPSSNRRTIHFNAASQEADMEVTQPYPAAPSGKSKNQRNTIHFSRNAQDGDMELTEELPAEMVKRAAAQKSSNRATIHFNSASQQADMEVTQSYPAASTTKDKIQRNTTHFNQNSQDTAKKITEMMNTVGHKVSSNKNIQINAYMEVAQPYIEPSTTKNKKQRNTTHFNRDAEEAEMESTNEIPPEIVNRAVEEEKTTKRQTIHFNAASQEADMDVTQTYSVPSQTKSKKQTNTLHFHRGSEDGGMELTEEIPLELVKRAMAEKSSSNRKTIHFNAASQEADMDETRAYPAAPKSTNSRQRNTIYFNRNGEDFDMELTEELPLETVQKASSNRQTIHFNVASQDANMEVTQTYCAPSTAASKKQRNTIHFNRNTEDGDMELTEQLPPEVAQIAAQKPASIRQTIHFNAVSDEAEMEITRASVPPFMKNEKQRNTIHFNQNSEAGQMDLTRELAPGMVKKDLSKSSSNRQTTHFCDASKEAEMEVTQAFCCIDSQMDLTQQLPVATTGRNQNTNDGKINFAEDTPKPYSCRSEKNQNMTSFNKQLSEIPNTQKESTITVNSEIDAETQKSSSDQQQRDTTNFTQNSEKHQIGIPITQTEPISESNHKTIYLKHTSEAANMDKTEPQPANANSQNKNKHEGLKLVSHAIRKTGCNANLAKSTLDNGKNLEDLTNEIMETNKNVVLKSNTQGNTRTEDIDDMNVDPTMTTLCVQKELIKETNQTSTACFNQKSEDTAQVDLAKSESNEITIEDKNNGTTCILVLENQERALSNADKNKEQFRNPKNLDSGSLQNLDENAEISGIELLENSSTEQIRNKIYTRKSVSETPIGNEAPISQDQLIIEPHLFRGGNNSDNFAFNEDEICQVIRLPGTYNPSMEYNPAIMQKQIYLSPQDIAHQVSFNVSKHFISYVDDTEKLINYKIGERPVSEYSKILNEDINLSDLKTNVLSRNSDEKNCSSFYVDLSSACLKSGEQDTRQADNKTEDSFIVINSSSESDSYCEIQQEAELKLSALIEPVTMPPCFAELYRSGSSSDFEVLCQASRNDLFRSFIEMSFHNGATITSESISLIESISDATDDFLAVSFAAREVEKMINKSVHLDADVDESSGEKGAPSGSGPGERSKCLPRSIKAKLDKVFPVPELKQIVLPAESEICPLRDDKQLESFAKWFKPPCREAKRAVSKQMTLEEKIKQLSEDTMWDIISINNEEFNFTYMFGSIEFCLILDRVTENVKSVEFFSRFVESESHPSARFVHSLLKRKLLQKSIRSACGQVYTIFTFLDYITMAGQQMLDILDEFDRLQMQYGVVLDSDLNASCRFVNKFLRVVFETRVNIEMLDSAPDAQVTVRPIVGNVRAAEIKQLAKGCPQGIPFIRAFILSVHEYLRLLQSSKEHKIKKTS